MSSLSVRQMLFGNISRTRHVVRFGTAFRLKDETVAEHQYFAALYAMLLGRALRLSDSDMSILLQRALIHDVEEAVSGDFPRGFKYSSVELRNNLDVAGSRAFEQVVSGLLGRTEQFHLKGLWTNAKQGNLGKLLEFCDFLSVLSYIGQELRVGNRMILDHCDGLMKYHSKFSGPKYGFLKPWINEAKVLCKELEDAKA